VSAGPNTIGLAHPDGNVQLYHRDEVNLCPDCGRAQWNIGRITAECVGCKAVFPLVTHHSLPLDL
jgi:hypothetical protein